ncbi:Serine/threonine protein kinase [hydrothermal vent metagenome]|uniref:Serine/threonine protein kinase n=1 Tax=hydrothermal vent metagenome TaxID=652676 RepID=A0A1W1CSD1_9ZZZZ
MNDDDEYRNALAIGDLILEFRIKNILGVGGFGITYLAYDSELDCDVVIKEYFPSDLAIRENSNVIAHSHSGKSFYSKGKERFYEEAKTLAKFKHPNIVQVKRRFESNNTVYFVMDFEEGEDLDSYIKKLPNHKLTEDEALSIILPICDGLKEIHSYNIYHRDIKPENIYLRENSSPMLIDFGSAKQIQDQDSHRYSSFNAQTLGYAAPEQQSSLSSLIGPHTDIYAIGATLYKCISGALPVSSEDRSTSITQQDYDPYESIHTKVNRSEYSYSKNNKATL